MFGSEVLQGTRCRGRAANRSYLLFLRHSAAKARATKAVHRAQAHTRSQAKQFGAKETTHTGSHSKIGKKNYYRIVRLDLIPVLISERKFCKGLDD